MVVSIFLFVPNVQSPYNTSSYYDCHQPFSFTHTQIRTHTFIQLNVDGKFIASLHYIHCNIIFLSVRQNLHLWQTKNAKYKKYMTEKGGKTEKINSSNIVAMISPSLLSKSPVRCVHTHTHADDTSMLLL